jgi:hypothetical protein
LDRGLANGTDQNVEKLLRNRHRALREGAEAL